MPYTFPNQRTITIHREELGESFLGINNANWKEAAHDLGAHALMLYMYLAANANGYNLALSPAAIAEAIGMPRSTYHDQFAKLVNKGYLVPSHGNTFDFYEKPRPRADRYAEEQTATVHESRAVYDWSTSAANGVLPKDTEIYNREKRDNGIDNNVHEESLCIRDTGEEFVF